MSGAFVSECAQYYTWSLQYWQCNGIPWFLLLFRSIRYLTFSIFTDNQVAFNTKGCIDKLGSEGLVMHHLFMVFIIYLEHTVDITGDGTFQDAHRTPT